MAKIKGSCVYSILIVGILWGLFAVGASASVSLNGTVPGCDAPDDSIVLSTPALHMAFAPSDAGMGIRCLVHARTGTEFVSRRWARMTPHLWKLEFTDDISQSLRYFAIDNMAEAVEKTVETTADGGVRMTWKGVRAPEGRPDLSADVTVEIGPTDFHDMSQWKINVAWESETAMLWRVVFPVIDLGVIGNSGENDYLLTSAAEGRAVRNPTGGEVILAENEDDFVVIRRSNQNFGFGPQRPYGLPYPSGRMSTQLTAYYEQNGSFYFPDAEPGPGLYMAVHDPMARPKVFFHTPYFGLNYLQYEIAHYPDESFQKQGEFNLPYPVVIGGFDGGWYDAAQIYRDWATKQRWTAQGPLSQRNDLPSWLLEANVVHRSDVRKNANETNVPLAGSYGTFLKSPVLAQWYNWSTKEKHPDATGYAFPPVADAPDGFDEVVAQLEASDVYVFPYFNVRKIGMHDPLLERFSPYLQHQADGKPYTLEGAAYDVSIWNEEFTEYLADTAREIARRYNVKGIYVDEGGTASFTGDWLTGGSFNPNEGGPIGVTPEMVEKEYERSLAILNAGRSVDPQFVLMGEVPAESFIDLYANRLTPFTIWPDYVPLFSAVYHEYVTSYGRTVYLLNPKDNPRDPVAPFTIGWLLNNGYQIGRVAGEVSRQDPVYVDFLRRADEIKTMFPEYLNYGRMKRPPSPTTTIPYMVTREYQRSGKIGYLPKVLASVWESENGSHLMIVTNISRDPVSLTFLLNTDDLAEGGTVNSVIKAYPVEDQVAPPVSCPCGQSGKIEIPVDLLGYGIEAYLISTTIPK